MDSRGQAKESLGDIVLGDHEGTGKTLAEWAGGRPLVVQMVRYYG